MNCKTSDSRIAYWDNAKAVLVFLVVLGHFLLPDQARNGRLVQSVFCWIYLFHIPAFVLISGFFAKGFVKRGGTDTDKLMGFLFLYVCFSLSLWLIQVVCSRTWSWFWPSVFSTTAAPWYLLCLFFWYLLIPHAARLRPALALPFSVVLGLSVGMVIPDGSFLSLSRCFAFLPFFLAGCFLPARWVAPPRRRMALLSLLVLAAVFFLFLFGLDALRPYLPLMEASGSYASLSLSWRTGMVARLAWYALAFVVTGAFLCVVPQRRLFFTCLGQRTLAIYVLHRLIRELFGQLGGYHHLGGGATYLLSCLGLSIVVTWACSGRKTSELFGKALSIPWTDGNRPGP